MISCTEFIYAYSELFRFLDEEGGFESLRRYWEEISDESIRTTLGKCVDEHGVHGCYEYWSHTLIEEAADFRMEYDGEKDCFSIEMRHCPSRGRLNERGKDCYPRYCEHCDILYRRVLEARGLRYSIDLSHCDEARCTIKVLPPDEIYKKTRRKIDDEVK